MLVVLGTFLVYLWRASHFPIWCLDLNQAWALRGRGGGGGGGGAGVSVKEGPIRANFASTLTMYLNELFILHLTETRCLACSEWAAWGYWDIVVCVVRVCMCATCMSSASLHSPSPSFRALSSLSLPSVVVVVVGWGGGGVPALRVRVCARRCCPVVVSHASVHGTSCGVVAGRNTVT